MSTPRCEDASSTFLDRDVACGHSFRPPCHCGRETQNAHTILMDVLGPARDPAE